MKRIWILALTVLLLGGCGSQETLETISDEAIQPAMAAPASITVKLPQEAAVPVLESDLQQIYLCEGYEITLENRPSGDLTETVRQISGFNREDLTVLQTEQGSTDRYEFVWVSAGETGDRLGRAVILDDGQYHYCLSVLRDASAGEEDRWDAVFASFRLTEGFIRTD